MKLFLVEFDNQVGIEKLKQVELFRQRSERSQRDLFEILP